MTRIAFISDIHANLEALLAVLTNIAETGADMTICLGDIVGYGPNPQECADIIRENEITTLMGNHDEFVSLIMDDSRMDRLREEVKQSIKWTASKLSIETMTWLAKLPQQLETDYFGLVHGSFERHHLYAYNIDEAAFARNFLSQPYQLAFCGHSHRPMIGMTMERNGKTETYVDYIRKGTIAPETGKVMVNVGAVGQPRDGDPRAAVVYYELETRELILKRVLYDLDTTIAKLERSPLPLNFAKRLKVGR